MKQNNVHTFLLLAATFSYFTEVKENPEELVYPLTSSKRQLQGTIISNVLLNRVLCIERIPFLDDFSYCIWLMKIPPSFYIVRISE